MKPHIMAFWIVVALMLSFVLGVISGYKDGWNAAEAARSEETSQAESMRDYLDRKIAEVHAINAELEAMNAKADAFLGQYDRSKSDR
jgi:hypothetical protein